MDWCVLTKTYFSLNFEVNYGYLIVDVIDGVVVEDGTALAGLDDADGRGVAETHVFRDLVVCRDAHHLIKIRFLFFKMSKK